MLAADLERIAESLGGQQRGPRALALDEGVGDQRRAVDERARASAARRPASWSSVTTPCSMASDGSSGVVSVLPTTNAPVASSKTTRSVNVPPMSTPSARDPIPGRSWEASVLRARKGRKNDQRRDPKATARLLQLAHGRGRTTPGARSVARRDDRVTRRGDGDHVVVLRGHGPETPTAPRLAVAKGGRRPCRRRTGSCRAPPRCPRRADAR